MSITKTKNNSYRLRLYYPQDIREKLNLQSKLYEKNFKTRREAKEAEIEFNVKIDKIRNQNNLAPYELKGESLFCDFYQTVWYPAYTSGQTTFKSTPPTRASIDGVERLFRLHILPLFGQYSLNYLVNNKALVLSMLTKKANEYANFKAFRSYFNSIFDWAEELEYIEGNKLSKSIKRIKATKKIQLEQNKINEDKYLSFDDLQSWLYAVQNEYESNILDLKDYTLFYTTFFLSCRKSEIYALQWKHIDFINNQIAIVQALDKFANVKVTKGNKETIFNIPEELVTILKLWKEQQKIELQPFGIKQDDNQFVFTYINTTGDVNARLHIDYLNNKMKSIQKRNKLIHATPHMLRHTGATLAKQSGVSLSTISEALTHSNSRITKTYINTPDTVEKAMGTLVFEQLKNHGGNTSGNLVGNMVGEK